MENREPDEQGSARTRSGGARSGGVRGGAAGRRKWRDRVATVLVVIAKGLGVWTIAAFAIAAFTLAVITPDSAVLGGNTPGEVVYGTMLAGLFVFIGWAVVGIPVSIAVTAVVMSVRKKCRELDRADATKEMGAVC